MNLKIKNMLAAIGASAAILALAPSAYADDYYFDMSKARQTFGNGTGSTYSDTTRLDNERRDQGKFNPLWLTEDSTIEMEFVSEGEYETAPAILVLQSWKGELVSSTEDKWILIPPTSYTETTATFTYDDIVSGYGGDLSDVYGINVNDSGNALLIKSMVATNVVVPEEDINDKFVGTLVKEGELPPGVEETQPEELDTELTETEPAIEEVTDTTSDENTSSESERNVEGTESSESSVSESPTTEPAVVEESNSILLIVLIAVGVLSVITIIIAIIAIKKKGRNYHRFK